MSNAEWNTLRSLYNSMIDVTALESVCVALWDATSRAIAHWHLWRSSQRTGGWLPAPHVEGTQLRCILLLLTQSVYTTQAQLQTVRKVCCGACSPRLGSSTNDKTYYCSLVMLSLCGFQICMIQKAVK